MCPRAAASNASLPVRRKGLLHRLSATVKVGVWGLRGGAQAGANDAAALERQRCKTQWAQRESQEIAHPKFCRGSACGDEARRGLVAYEVAAVVALSGSP